VPAQERQEPGLLGPEEGARRRLLAAPINMIGLLPHSSNHTFLVQLGQTSDAKASLAVYKPSSGERPLYDFPGGTLYQREVAAYQLSRALAWDLVPPTVVRTDAPLGPGSLQLYVDHDPNHHYFSLLSGRKAVFKRLAVFDILCNNADRKAGHCLLDGDGRIWAVDHGLTFNSQPKLRTVIWDFAGRPIPARDRLAVAGMATGLSQTGSKLRSIFCELLAEDEVEALNQRAVALSQPCDYPAPSSDWSFPWPLV
jgi:uncharacterized repeat protein (TIGR03843 family)